MRRCRAGRIRPRSLGGLLFALLVLAAGYLWNAYFAEQMPPQEGELSLVVLDVGQGDSLLLCSEGKWALVDAGTPESAPVVLKALKDYGVSSLELAVATHPHADHIGGMAAVLDACPPGEFWMPDAVHTSAAYENMLDAVERSGADAVLAQTGDTFALGSARITVLSPGGDAPYAGSLNNMSLVLLCEGGGVRLLLTGDAELPVEQALLQNGLPQADVLKAGHHGSSTSSSRAFLQAVRPRYAVISCAAGNSYGHPHRETLEAFADMGVQVLRTDTQGSILLNASGGNIDVYTER